MAGKQYQDEFSTEDYYANGMLRETPEVPSNHPRKSKNTTPSGKQKKRAAAGKYFSTYNCPTKSPSASSNIDTARFQRGLGSFWPAIVRL